MSAYGIAGLVDGFFKGRQIKDGWEDRKDTKKRQAKQDEYTAAEQSRIAERHGWARDQYGRSVSDYDRERADDDAFRKANQDAIDATEAAMAEGSQPGGVTTSTMGAPPPPGPSSEAAARLPAAVDAATRGSAAADQFQRYFDPSDLGAAPPPVAGGPPAGPRRADVMPDDTRGPAIQEARDNRAMPPRTIEDMRAQAIAEARAMQDMGAAPPQDARSIVPPMNMPDNPRLQMEGPGPGGGGMAPLYDQGILPRRYVGDPSARAEQPAQADPMAGFDREQMSRDMADRLSRDQPNYAHDWGNKGLGADAREVVNRSAAALGAVPRAAVNTAVDLNNAAVDIARPAVKYATGGEDGFEIPYTPRLPDALGAPPRTAPAPSADVTRARTAAAQPAPPPAAGPGPRISNVPASAPPAVKQLAAVADQAMGEASTPAVEAAAAAVAKDDPALGASGNRPYSEKQRERASTAFMERYMEVGAPIVIKEYLRRGEIDKAQKFQEFLDQGATKAGMKNWARASFAASVGDFDSFATEIMEGYNRLDYFGDDTTIVTTESGFTDAEGKITKDNRKIAGAKIVFKDEKTGKTFEQVYDSPEDIVTMGVTLLAPEEAFEYWVRKTDAAREAALGAAKVDQEKAEKAAEARAKSVEAAALAIFKAAKESINPADQAMTMEQAMEEAEAAIPGGAPRRAEADPLGGAESAAPPGPPVLRRP